MFFVRETVTDARLLIFSDALSANRLKRVEFQELWAKAALIAYLKLAWAISLRTDKSAVV